MNADLKARWLAALRSGEYKRGSSTLKRAINRGGHFTGRYEHCCLGVLCEIVGVPLVRLDPSDFSMGEHVIVKQDGTPSNQHGYIELEGWRSTVGLDVGQQVKLASINDYDTGDGYTLAIEWIEKEL